jgi:hypothetical protein
MSYGSKSSLLAVGGLLAQSYLVWVILAELLRGKVAPPPLAAVGWWLCLSFPALHGFALYYGNQARKGSLGSQIGAWFGLVLSGTALAVSVLALVFAAVYVVFVILTASLLR